MKNFIGIAIIMLGAVLLVACYFEPTGELVDSNLSKMLGVGIIIAGIVAHILIPKYSK